jgi:hypothetical protein
VVKTDQWVLLSRFHAQAIIYFVDSVNGTLAKSSQCFWTLFKKVSASDEMFVSVSLALLGLLDTKTIQRRATFVDWTDQDNPSVLSARSPRTFTCLSVRENSLRTTFRAYDLFV